MRFRNLFKLENFACLASIANAVFTILVPNPITGKIVFSQLAAAIISVKTKDKHMNKVVDVVINGLGLNLGNASNDMRDNYHN